MKYEIKELSIGGILDQTIILLADNFRVLVGIGAVLLLPVTFLQQFLALLIPVNRMGQIEIPEFPIAVALLLTWGVYGFFLMPLAYAALIRAAARCYLGKEVSVKTSITQSFSYILPLLLTWFLQGLLTLGGYLLFIVPGIILYLMFALTSNIVVLEQISGTAALSRSRELMVGYKRSLFVLFFLYGVIFGLFGTGPTAFIGDGILSATTLTFFSLVATVFLSVMLVVLYVSARCKHENFDLELLINRIRQAEAARPAETEFE